jgi:uncharacterized protein
MSEEIEIEVVYALPHEQLIVPLKIKLGTTVAQAIECSGVLEKYPEIDLTQNKVGIFGKLTKLHAVLRNKDRVEIYRPLIANPKEVRRKRADAAAAVKRGSGL